MLGDELRKARLAAKLTQEEVAARAGVSREYIRKLEHNRQSPAVDTLLRICRILDANAFRLIAKVEWGFRWDIADDAGVAHTSAMGDKCGQPARTVWSN